MTICYPEQETKMVTSEINSSDSFMDRRLLIYDLNQMYSVWYNWMSMKFSFLFVLVCVLRHVVCWSSSSDIS